MKEKNRYSEDMQRIADDILMSSGETSQTLRQAIQGRAFAISSHTSSEKENIPSELIPYIDKIALHAYKVTDEDIATLREQGHSEDALFEITLSAALGTSLARLHYGLTALEECE